jgi:tRNA pseudouridine38-40 synthase
MPNVKLEIEFDGTRYFGWQFQPNRITVQATVEKALAQLYGCPIRAFGAGRTDTGVSALVYAANFAAPRELSPAAIAAALNQRLPNDIRVHNAEVVPDSFNARYDARSKVYRYTIVRQRSPLLARHAWEIAAPLDLKLLRRAARRYVGEHDFAPFCRILTGPEPVRVKRVGIAERRSSRTGARLLQIEIEGNRFLYKMVRRMVGALIDVGRGKFTEGELARAVKHGPRVQFSTAPACGLVLVRVKYANRRKPDA